MNRNDNMLLAKKYIVESIYSSVKVEGLALTFPETEQILENKEINKYYNDDVDFVNDLKHAWQYVFNNIALPIDLNVVKTINRIAGKYTVINAGIIRTPWDDAIGVRGENGDIVYRPPIPQKESVINSEIIERYSLDDKTDSALELYMYLTKSQLFNDGNKRTANLICNMVLIQHGKGLFIVPPEMDYDFKKRLLNYYVDDDSEQFKSYLKSNCIFKPTEYTFGQKIQMLRERDNISRSELAKVIGTTEKNILLIEKDKVNISDDMLAALSSFFEVEEKLLCCDHVADNKICDSRSDDDILDLTQGNTRLSR